MNNAIDITLENTGVVMEVENFDTENNTILVSLSRNGVDADVDSVAPSITVDFGSLPQNVYWDEIQDKPDFHPVATSGDYDDLENKPNLHQVATTGDYQDLENKPNLSEVATSGDYGDLTGKPRINNVTLNGNKSAADIGLATAAQGAKADTAYQKPIGGIPGSDMSAAVQSALEKAETALQEHQSLEGYATEAWVEGKGYLTEHQDISGKADKSETYTKSEVTDLIAALHAARFERVNALPVTGETNVIYLVPAPQQQSGNIYNEYIYINNGWELIGNTSIDLSNYYNKSQVDSKIAALHTAESIGFSYPPFNINTANAENSYVYGADGKLYLLPIGHVAGVSWDSTQKQLVDILTELGGKADMPTRVDPYSVNFIRFGTNGKLEDSGYNYNSFPKLRFVDDIENIPRDVMVKVQEGDVFVEYTDMYEPRNVYYVKGGTLVGGIKELIHFDEDSYTIVTYELLEYSSTRIVNIATSEQAVPPGGTTGQVLAKKSDADNDVEWVEQTGGGTGDYEELDNLPSVNGVTLIGDLETEDLNIEALTNEEIDQLLV